MIGVADFLTPIGTYSSIFICRIISVSGQVVQLCVAAPGTVHVGDLLEAS